LLVSCPEFDELCGSVSLAKGLDRGIGGCRLDVEQPTRTPAGLGSVIVASGVLIAFHHWLPRATTVGGSLDFVLSFVTLSFMLTTPDCWVPQGVPLLKGAGRLVVKDAITVGAALVTMAGSAKA
jgi:uncharacterized membrane protein YkgB